MSRKNRKSKFKSMHAKDLAKNKHDTEKLELSLVRLKDKINEVPEERLNTDDKDVQNNNGMEIEDQARKGKIRKNKMFQKRTLLEERKRLKRYR